MKWRAFTIIEMLIATALAAVLMILVMKVTSTIGKAHAMLQGQSQESLLARSATEWIERDLAMSQTYTLGDGTLLIQTLNRLDPGAPRGMRHAATTARYRLITPTDAGQNGTIWVREQIEGFDEERRPGRVDVLAHGVALFQVRMKATPVTDDDLESPTRRLVLEWVMTEQPEVTLQQEVLLTP